MFNITIQYKHNHQHSILYTSLFESYQASAYTLLTLLTSFTTFLAPSVLVPVV